MMVCFEAGKHNNTNGLPDRHRTQSRLTFAAHFLGASLPCFFHCLVSWSLDPCTTSTYLRFGQVNQTILLHLKHTSGVFQHRAAAAMASSKSTQEADALDMRDLGFSYYSLSEKLLLTSPKYEHDPAHRSSGLCCAIVFIRIFYGYYTLRFAEKDRPDIANMELDNPFMRFAWKDFGHSCSATIRDLVHAVWRKSLDEVEIERLSFVDIISSQAMCSTLWSMDECRPFRDPAWCSSGSTQWLSPVNSTPSPSTAAFLDSLQSPLVPNMLHVLAKPDMDLGHEVRTRFNAFLVDGVEIVVPASPCPFLHLRFNVQGVSTSERLNLAQFLSLQLGIFDFVQGVDKEFDWRMVDIVTYRLVAIVRHRNSPEESDSIRMYSLDGESFPDRMGQVAYTAPKWDFTDFNNSSTFTGLYINSSTEIDLTLGPPPTIVDLKVWKELGI